MLSHAHFYEPAAYFHTVVPDHHIFDARHVLPVDPYEHFDDVAEEYDHYDLVHDNLHMFDVHPHHHHDFMHGHFGDVAAHPYELMFLKGKKKGGKKRGGGFLGKVGGFAKKAAPIAAKFAGGPVGAAASMALGGLDEEPDFDNQLIY